MQRIIGLVFSGFSVKAFALCAALWIGSVAASYVSDVFAAGAPIAAALESAK